MPANQQARIVLGVTGGVAAYKAVELCRRLVDRGYFVSPILTENATRFIGEATFAAVASESPRLSLWDSPEPSPHTTLGQGADVVVVAPATARFLAAYTNGLSDDLLTTTVLATRAQVIVCPAMHTEMWEHPAVQHNISLLRERGVVVVEPESGPLAGGDVGVGRLAEVETIVAMVDSQLRRGADLAGRTIVVTAGGTREAIDPVRFVGNRSSGRQGHAVAEAARDRGAKVVLITTAAGNAPHGVDVLAVETAAEMHDAVLHHLSDADVLVMAAAVADFRPTAVADHKLKKAEGPPEIHLEPTVDILEVVARKRRDDQVIVGFAAETTRTEDSAREKLVRKELDLIVANDVTEEGAGFEYPTNSVIFISKSGRKSHTGTVSKRTVADNLLDQVVHELSHGGPS